jgi:hypothetical protein
MLHLRTTTNLHETGLHMPADIREDSTSTLHTHFGASGHEGRILTAPPRPDGLKVGGRQPKEAKTTVSRRRRRRQGLSCSCSCSAHCTSSRGQGLPAPPAADSGRGIGCGGTWAMPPRLRSRGGGVPPCPAAGFLSAPAFLGGRARAPGPWSGHGADGRRAARRHTRPARSPGDWGVVCWFPTGQFDYFDQRMPS